MKKKEIKRFKRTVRRMIDRYEMIGDKMNVLYGLQHSMYLIGGYSVVQAMHAVLTYTEFHRNMRDAYDYSNAHRIVPFRPEDYHFLLFLDQLSVEDYKDFSVFSDYPTSRIPPSQQKDIRK